MSKSKNDLAWEKIFQKFSILNKINDENCATIRASEINQFREARLMTKFDYRSQLPQLFADNELSILPISRGDYIIGRFETFKNFDEDILVQTKCFEFPPFLESINFKNITSESTALNCAFVSKILHDFLGEEDLYPTINGRMSSKKFRFSISSNTQKTVIIDVENSQLEIDGGYEGMSSLNIIEAKNSLSNDFIIRQLYYPYRLWQDTVKKQVNTVFLTYSNGIFHLRKYAFTDLKHYNSIELIKQQKYSIGNVVINTEVIQKILNTISIISEPSIPFPQADAFDRIINLFELINEKTTIQKEEITSNYDFDERQTDYYTSAGRYLGLIDKKIESDIVLFNLSSEGKRLFDLDLKERQLFFIEAILRHGVFNKILKLFFATGRQPAKEEIVEIMKVSSLFNIHSESTYQRRASTIVGWLNWIINQMEE